MTVTNKRFNRNPIKLGGAIPQPSQEIIKNTPSLHNASFDDAMKYGGVLTKQALHAMDLKFDKKNIIVDTKVHMLMPDFSPALSGWHTDGVPRGYTLNPTGKGKPNIHAQDWEELQDASRFHLLVTGQGCLTKFLQQSDVVLEVPEEPNTALYSMLDAQVEERIKYGLLSEYEIPSCRAVQWDWWDLHTAQPAKHHEWRFLIRVTETDLDQQPKNDIRDIIRTQQQVYLPQNFGW